MGVATGFSDPVELVAATSQRLRRHRARLRSRRRLRGLGGAIFGPNLANATVSNLTLIIRLYLRWADRPFVWLYRRFPRILDAITIVRARNFEVPWQPAKRDRTYNGENTIHASVALKF